jgi:hypothetical protein
MASLGRFRTPSARRQNPHRLPLASFRKIGARVERQQNPHRLPLASFRKIGTRVEYSQSPRGLPLGSVKFRSAPPAPNYSCSRRPKHSARRFALQSSRQPFPRIPSTELSAACSPKLREISPNSIFLVDGEWPCGANHVGQATEPDVRPESPRPCSARVFDPAGTPDRRSQLLKWGDGRSGFLFDPAPGTIYLVFRRTPCGLTPCLWVIYEFGVHSM